MRWALMRALVMNDAALLFLVIGLAVAAACSPMKSN